MKEGKLFDQWNFLKQKIDGRKLAPYIHPSEVWWCSVGINVGFEIDGKNQNCERPVLVLKVVSPNTFLGLPLTLKIKKGNFGYVFVAKNNTHQVLFAQIRIFDMRRVNRKLFNLNAVLFEEIKKRLREWL